MSQLQGLGRRYGAFIDGIINKENNANLTYLCDVITRVN